MESRSIVALVVYDLEALRELDTTLFCPDQEAIASDSDVASADTLSTAKRVDRSVDDDEYFSNVDVASPPAPAAEGTDDLELAAIAADVLELRSKGCGCGTNYYLMFPEGKLVSLMISTLKRLSKQDKNMFDLGELTASLQTASATAGKRQHSFIKFTPAWVTRYAACLSRKSMPSNCSHCAHYRIRWQAVRLHHPSRICWLCSRQCSCELGTHGAWSMEVPAH